MSGKSYIFIVYDFRSSTLIVRIWIRTAEKLAVPLAERLAERLTEQLAQRCMALTEIVGIIAAASAPLLQM